MSRSRIPRFVVVLVASLLMHPLVASGECRGGEACAEPCPAENSCRSNIECGPVMACKPWGPGLPCLPSSCGCYEPSGTWICTRDCADQCVLVDCNDGNPCTDDSFVTGGCVHTPVGGAELIAVEMPGLAGGYIFNTRESEVSLGFSLFEIGCLAIEWAGGIYTSTVDCSGGNLQGYGGTLTASFVSAPASSVSFTEIGGEPFSLIPFDRLDKLPGVPPYLLVDGTASVRVAFEQIMQECYIVEPAMAVVDSAGLIVAARRMHDFDSDGQVKLNDAAEFLKCMDGPNGGFGFGCLIFADDGDEDVDLTDAAAFQRAFTGP